MCDTEWSTCKKFIDLKYLIQHSVITDFVYELYTQNDASYQHIFTVDFCDHTMICVRSNFW